MNTIFALFDLGGGQILLILALILIFFGARRIPELAKGLGQGIKEFKKATREVTDEIHRAGEEDERQARLKREEAERVAHAKQINESSEAEKPVAQSPENKA